MCIICSLSTLEEHDEIASDVGLFDYDGLEQDGLFGSAKIPDTDCRNSNPFLFPLPSSDRYPQTLLSGLYAAKW